MDADFPRKCVLSRPLSSKFGSQYSFHALCLSRGQQAPYGGHGRQISNKRRCIDNDGALWGTSRVRATPPAKATLFESLAAIAYSFYPWSKPRALPCCEHSSVEVVMWVSRPKIGGSAVPRRLIREPGWRDFWCRQELQWTGSLVWHVLLTWLAVAMSSSKSGRM